MMKLNKTHVGKLFYFMDLFSGNSCRYSQKDLRYSISAQTRCDISGLCYLIDVKNINSNISYIKTQSITYLHSSGMIYTAHLCDWQQILCLNFIVD